MLATELQNKDEIYEILEKSWHDDDGSLLPPMFHGTDAALINTTEAERKELYTSCDTIITSLFKLYKANSIKLTDRRLVDSRDSYGHSATAYVFAEARANKSPLYSYGNFYVTNNPERAVGYSQESWIFGETGWIANRLVEGAEAVGIALPQDNSFNKAFELFDLRRQNAKKPIVLMIINGSSEKLSRESGENFKKYYQNNFSKEIQNIKDMTAITRSFRLEIFSPQESSDIYLIKEEHYTELKKAWEKALESRKN